MILRPIIRPLFKLATPLWQWMYKYKSSKNQVFTYNKMIFEIPAGIFHPGLFFSSKILVKHLKKLNLNNKEVLEIGCGSGFVAINAAMLNANVCAVDINPIAVEVTKKNAAKNKVNIESYQSNLFKNIGTKNKFNFIITNPPFYPKNPKNEAEMAWFCGENYNFFNNFFSQSINHLTTKGEVIMVLSEDCNINEILKISKNNNLIISSKTQYSNWLEKNYVFTFIKK